MKEAGPPVLEDERSADRASSDVVVRDGCVHWHTLASCEVRDAREGVVAYRVTLRDAWASCLLPCPACGSDEARRAGECWGTPTSVERARLTLPVLQDLVTGVTIVPPSPHRCGSSRMPPLPPAPEHRPTPAVRLRVSTRRQ